MYASLFRVSPLVFFDYNFEIPKLFDANWQKKN